jgi:hypothetical protein
MTTEKVIQYNDDNYVVLRSIHNHPIDRTIVVSKGDIEIDMSGELIVGIAIKSMNKIFNFKQENEYIIVQMHRNIDCNHITTVDCVGLTSSSEVFVYRNEKDEVLQIVIYEPSHHSLSDHFQLLNI